ncbi:hypothetical protein QJQ45_020072, partial [Haematococcus lacustris]
GLYLAINKTMLANKTVSGRPHRRTAVPGCCSVRWTKTSLRPRCFFVVSSWRHAVRSVSARPTTTRLAPPQAAGKHLGASAAAAAAAALLLTAGAPSWADIPVAPSQDPASTSKSGNMLAPAVGAVTRVSQGLVEGSNKVDAKDMLSKMELGGDLAKLDKEIGEQVTGAVRQGAVDVKAEVVEDVKAVQEAANRGEPITKQQADGIQSNLAQLKSIVGA